MSVRENRTITDERNDVQADRSVHEDRKSPVPWILLLLAIVALIVAGFFLLGGDADVDTEGGDIDIETPQVDADIAPPDIDIEGGEAPDIDIDTGESPDVDIETGEAEADADAP